MEFNKTVITLVTLVACLVFGALASHLVSSSFGAPPNPLDLQMFAAITLTALAAGAVAWVATGLFGEASVLRGAEAITTGTATAMLCMFSFIGISGYQGSTPIALDSQVAYQARMVAAAGASNLGMPTPLSRQVASATQSWDAMKANRALVSEVASATTDATQVMTHLKAARQWGVDATFVAKNGVLRASDRRELFGHATPASVALNQ